MRFVGFFSLLLAASLGTSEANAEARFIGLGDLPGGDFYSQGFGVTHDGAEIVAAGGSFSGAGQEAFRFTETLGMVGVGDLPGGTVDAEARSISADGTRMVGFSEGPEGTEAFLWTEGSGMVGLGDLPGGEFLSRAYAITPDGAVVVGEASDASGTVAVRWTETGGYEVLGDLPGGAVLGQAFAVTPDGSRVAGVGASAASGFEAFLWTEGLGFEALGSLDGTAGSRAKALSADGNVVVGFASSPAGFEAFRWTQALGMQSLGDLPGGSVFGQANGVTEDGDIIVGLSATGNPAVPFTFEAFLWTERDGMRLFKDVLEQDYGLDLAGWIPWEILGITPSGHHIVGIAANPEGNREAFVAELPVTACHNGIDDDGDGFTDLEDPACENLAADDEASPCQNGLDDDNDGTVDFDGGASIHGSAIAPPDAACVEAFHRMEGQRCGLGAELALVLAALLRWRSRSR